ncbi:MAG: ATP-binding protein [Thermodesulfobacteriota bacterium]
MKIRPRLVGIRMFIAIQVFTTLLVLATGFLAIEINQRKLLQPRKQPTISDVKKATRDMRIYVLIGGFVACLSGVVLTYAIKEPIRKLTRGVQSVAQGDLSKSLDLFPQEEINQLVQAYNHMVSSLNQYLLETSAGVVVTINSDGIITTVNPAAETIFDHDARDVVGRHFTDLFPPHGINRGLTDMILRGIEKEMPSSLENVTVMTDKGKKFAMKIRTALLGAAEGRLLEVVASFRDLREIKEIQGEMERINRLASLGSLVAGLAHEIRSPLGSLKGLAQLLQEDIIEKGGKAEYIEVIIKEIDRLNKVVEELLTFAQPSSFKFEDRDIEEIVRDTVSLAKTGFPGKKVSVMEDYQGGLPRIAVEGDKMTQAVLNIINNALEATPEGGTIKVKTGLVPQSSEREDDTAGIRGAVASAQQRVMIDVFNTGDSISFEDSERVFNPFFTTKPGGIGLGLSIAQQIVTAHRGHIRVMNEMEGKPKGVIFRIELPITGMETPDVSGLPSPS